MASIKAISKRVWLATNPLRNLRLNSNCYLIIIHLMSLVNWNVLIDWVVSRFVQSYPELSVIPHGEWTGRLLEFLDCK